MAAPFGGWFAEAQQAAVTKDETAEKRQQAVERVFGCAVLTDGRRYYPMKGAIHVHTRDPATGRFSVKPSRYLDPIARWYERGLTFTLFFWPTTPGGGMDLAREPHAVLAVPNAAFESVGVGETREFNGGLLFRWGPDRFYKQLPIRLTRAPEKFDYRYELVEPVEVFTTPADNPRAARVGFTIDYTWACEQDIARGLAEAKMSRAELMKLTLDLIESRSKEMADGQIKVPPQFLLGEEARRLRGEGTE